MCRRRCWCTGSPAHTLLPCGGMWSPARRTSATAQCPVALCGTWAPFLQTPSTTRTASPTCACSLCSTTSPPTSAVPVAAPARVRETQTGRPLAGTRCRVAPAPGPTARRTAQSPRAPTHRQQPAGPPLPIQVSPRRNGRPLLRAWCRKVRLPHRPPRRLPGRGICKKPFRSASTCRSFLIRASSRSSLTSPPKHGGSRLAW
mmetsp:Transcript_27404/g.68793  ORF Transcript_27404/g.68793 Transcript_27404/m.68793 type:complete len:202 (-) Transcript_27404:681-1286(-)